MKRLIIILQILIPLISCEYSVSKSRIISEEIRDTSIVIERHHYDSLTIPLFFSALCQNHLNDFYAKDSSSFIQFCDENNISQTDSSNISKFFTINILHEIFTSNSAANCSKGDIINIPYQWHWVTPNPRNEIHFTSDNSLLKDTKPPKEFSKYRSFADIDRTPYLFISDLVSAEEKYFSSSCDTFSTFGWCSEREMAFIALIKLLEYEGKVVSRGNHSWSELIISLKLNNGDFQNFKVAVDNTFNSINWEIISIKDLPIWRIDLGSSDIAKWYNNKAASKNELHKIKTHLVPNKAMLRIENQMIEYLKLKK